MSILRSAVGTLVSGVAASLVVGWLDDQDRSIMEIASDWWSELQPDEPAGDSGNNSYSPRQPGGPEWPGNSPRDRDQPETSETGPFPDPVQESRNGDGIAQGPDVGGAET
jgi:hypothetical protein